MARQVSNFEALAGGKSLGHLHEIFLLIFADLKKHTFTYQFLSSATPVSNYKVLKREKSGEFFTKIEPIDGVEISVKLSNFLKEL